MVSHVNPLACMRVRLVLLSLALVGCVNRLRLNGVQEYRSELLPLREIPTGDRVPGSYIVQPGDTILMEAGGGNTFGLTLKGRNNQSWNIASARSEAVPAYVLGKLKSLTFTITGAGTGLVEMSGFEPGKATWADLVAQWGKKHEEQPDQYALLPSPRIVPRPFECALPGDTLRVSRMFRVDYAGEGSEHLEQLSVTVDARGFVAVPLPRPLSAPQNGATSPTTPFSSEVAGGLDSASLSIRVWNPARPYADQPQLVDVERCLDALAVPCESGSEAARALCAERHLEIQGEATCVNSTKDADVRYRVTGADRSWTLVTEVGSKEVVPFAPGQSIADEATKVYSRVRGQELLREGFAVITVLPRAELRTAQASAFYFILDPTLPRPSVLLFPGDTVFVSRYRPEAE